jgi:hypothetical protein
VQPHAGNAFALPENFALKPRGSGQRLPESIQKKMESFFNTSFADVRVHVGNEAPLIGALAFTHGTDLYFAPGQYNPHSTHGQQLLGHELSHVLQQRAGRVRNPFGSGIAVVQDHAMEAEAAATAMRVLAHRPYGETVQPASAVGVLGGPKCMQRKVGSVVQPGKKRRHIATGALFGSIVPVVGTGVGAAIGYAVYKAKKNRARQAGALIVQNLQQTITQSPQEIFNEIAPAAISCAADMVRNHSPLRDILDYLAGKRKEVAVRAGTYGKSARFGDMRQPVEGDLVEYQNLMTNQKESLWDRNYRSVRYGTTSTELLRGRDEVYKGEPDRVKAHMLELSLVGNNKHFQYEKIGGNEVYQSISEGGIRLTAVLKSEGGDMEYIHTNEAYIGGLIEAASVYHKRMTNESRAESKLELLGEVVWTLTHAMPYYRGSASVAEWYSEAVNMAYGLGLGERKGKLDLVAFRTSHRDYSTNFAGVWSGTYS